MCGGGCGIPSAPIRRHYYITFCFGGTVSPKGEQYCSPNGLQELEEAVNGQGRSYAHLEMRSVASRRGRICLLSFF